MKACICDAYEHLNCEVVGAECAMRQDFQYEVVGKSGYLYVVPKEVFDLIPSENKRMVEK